MIEIKKGITRKHVTSQTLIDFFLEHEDYSGHLYIGYPILFSGGESITVDALWISEQYGIIIFDLIEDENDCASYENRQNLIYGKIESQLVAYPELKRGRREFLVDIEIISFASNICETDIDNFIVNNTNDIETFINDRQEWAHPELFEKVLSILQSVVNLKTKSNRVVKKPDSKGAKLKKLETTIATLDRSQEKAVIEYFEGIQRIRGLAGSGKTIVLALKAAYFHTQFPDWDIAVTFNTRSLKEQFKELITKFCVEKKRETPNWSKIKVVNAWGRPNDSDNEKGIYYDYCVSNGIEYFDFKKAKSINVNNPFKAVCSNALKSTKKSVEKYDVILVDEAQDLSDEFLNLCYRLLKGENKRLIYAYDELQKLNEGASLRNPQEFLIPKKKKYDDRILDVCYRNSRPLLVAAHSLGFGIYRKNDENENNLVQFFDQPQLWRDVGYELKDGEFKAGSTVTLQRTQESSPVYLEKHSDIDDLIIFKSCNNKEEQAQWIAKEIERNLKEDELVHKDIIVINPIALSTKEEVSIIRSILLKNDINNHIAGEFNADKFFEEDSVTFTGINRAKGNEVPMVYIINAHDCYSGSAFNERDLIRRRNILFTAITRSKAWVRIVGIGKNMDKLKQEYEEIKDNNFEMNFTYPSQKEIERMNIIHRDITNDEERKIKKDVESIKNIMSIIKQIERKETFLEDYPEEVQKIIKTLLGKYE